MVAECSAETSVTINQTAQSRIAKRLQAAQNLFSFKVQGKEMKDLDCNFRSSAAYSLSCCHEAVNSSENRSEPS